MIIKTKDSYKWIILAISFLLMVTFAISLQALSPIFEQIKEDISLSNTQAGLLTGAYTIPGIFLPFFIAYLANKFNEKFIILISLLTLGLGVVAFAIANSFNTLFTYRLVSGIGATAIAVLSPTLITIFFDEKNIGVGMGVFNAGVPTGTVIAANLFGVLGENYYWRSIMLGIALFIGLIFIINYFTLSTPDRENNVETSISLKEQLHSIASNYRLWLLAIIWLLANAQLLSYTTFGSQYYQSLGISTQRSGFLTSLIMFIPIFLSIVIGIIIDKTGWKKRLLLIGGIIVGITYIIIGRSSGNLFLWAIILGIGFTPIPVLVFSILPDIVKPNQTGIGLGVLTSASNLGIFIGSSSFGTILDQTGGDFRIGFMIIGLMSIGIILSTLGLKEVDW